jgi:methylenetetrahydrofolate dehydrogenase (NADP+) / methenyltetrahydrofolate cyclohydrolase
MTAIILDGKNLALRLERKLKEQVELMTSKPGLAIVVVGNDPASELYVRKKEKSCKSLGMNFFRYNFSENITEDKIITTINFLNKDHKVNGLMVQLPLPKTMDTVNITNSIDHHKDVDGLTSRTLGDLFQRNEWQVPATPKGVIRLLEEYSIPVTGKDVIIINRSSIVGKPLAALLLNRNATVTLCHSFSQDLDSKISKADIIISGTGKPSFIRKDNIKEGAVIIDVGIIKTDGKVRGDVDFVDVCEKASYITPVPGGVGPMTVVMLMENVLAAKLRQER